jgi:hypothetical protein
MKRGPRPQLQLPRWARPKLAADQRRDLAIIQLQKLADLDAGLATEATLWDLVRDALTWKHTAELLNVGQAEMATALQLVQQLVEHYGRTGRVEWIEPAHTAALRLAVAWFEDLAQLVDRDTAVQAAAMSEVMVERLRIEPAQDRRAA